jgi:DNA-binding transcriptional LysR family regulator
MRKLPSLSALRAFEAAARLHSVGKAAAELNVTHPAVSHQLKQLEGYFQQVLMVKQGRGVTATEAGAQLAQVLGGAFDDIAQACARLEQQQTRPALVVACTPSVASRWLIPLLPSFATRHPDVQLQIVYASQTADHIDEGIDVLIRHWDGPYRGPYASQPLLSGETRPVCNPSLLAQLGDPAQWWQLPLLHDQSPQGWQTWFATAGLPAPALNSGVVYEDFNLMSTAAIAGHGVALCPTALIQQELANRYLVELSPLSASRERRYLLLHRPGGSELVTAFRDWLVQR